MQGLHDLLRDSDGNVFCECGFCGHVYFYQDNQLHGIQGHAPLAAYLGYTTMSSDETELERPDTAGLQY